MLMPRKTLRKRESSTISTSTKLIILLSLPLWYLPITKDATQYTCIKYNSTTVTQN